MVKLLGPIECPVPNQFLQFDITVVKSVFIKLPKKNNATECGDYSTISLMSHILEVLLKIIYLRVYEKCERSSGMQQFGFKNGFGCREVLICALNVLAQRCRDVNPKLSMLYRL